MAIFFFCRGIAGQGYCVASKNPLDPVTTTPWSQRKTLIIAEAGVNHNGDLALAHQLVKAAAEAGADYVKFQTFRAELVISPQAPKADYQLSTTGGQESQLEMVRRLELDEAAHHWLLESCRSAGIRFLSTGFDLPSLQLLNRLDLDMIKIPSGEVTHVPLLRAAARMGKPLAVSTGMCCLGEVEQTVEILCSAGAPRSSLLLLHCNTEYPTPPEDVNLRAMATLGQALDLPFGYSDHSEGTCVPVAAVALGARLIEKHLTLDRTLPGPDHQASLEPAEFARMVAEIRTIERALGSVVKRPSPSESKNRAIARRSLVAAAPIRQGETFSEQNLACKRPGHGLSPLLWDHLLGRAASRDYAPDDMIDEGIPSQ